MLACAAAVLFWGSLVVLGYVYVGYPALLFALARLRPQSLRPPATAEPSVSVLVAAYNEEKAIAAKLQNLLALDYPPEKVQVIVASDGSRDDTVAIARRFDPARVMVLDLPRGGKTRALNAAAERASGEILVMTDATTELMPETLRSLLVPFEDPRVGCVAADLHYEGGESGVARGTGAYWRYERWIRSLEERVGGIIGCSGALYAVRRAAHRPIHAELDDDFTMPGEVRAQGLITAYSRAATSKELANDDEGADFRMRVRVVVRAVNALVRRRVVLNPFRFGYFALQMWSHKVLRYLAPLFLGGALVGHVGVVLDGSRPSWLYVGMFVIHIGLYVAAGAGWLGQRFGVRLPGVHIPYYFVLVNAAAAVGIARYLLGDRAITWETAR